MLSCLCTTYFNTVKTIEKQQEVYGIIAEMNQIVVLIITAGTE